MNDLKPAISIIVPVYNIAAYLRKCLDSVLAQTFLNFEIIIINDGSTDQSKEICDEYAKKDRRIKAIHQTNQGVSKARNMGVELAAGDFIGFVDGDDYIYKDMFEKLYSACMNTGSDISICNLGREINGQLINNTTEKSYQKVLNNEEAMRELFKGILYRFSLCNKLFHKTCFRNISFPEGRIHEDLSTTYRLFANANQSVYLNDIGYIYVKRKNSILTSTFNRERMDAFVGWNEILNFMKDNYKQLSHNIYACLSYWCIDNIYYILSQVETISQDDYLKDIQAFVRKYYWKIINNQLLSVKYKLLMTLFSMSTQLFCLSNDIRFKRVPSLKKEN